MEPAYGADVVGGLRIGGRSQEFVRAELSRFIGTEEWIAEEKRWRYPILTLHYTLEIELPYVAVDELEFDPDVRIAVKDFPSPSEGPGRCRCVLRSRPRRRRAAASLPHGR